MTQKYQVITVIFTVIFPIIAIRSAEYGKKQVQLDPMLDEYQELTIPIKENIMGKLELVRKKTEYTTGILKRETIIENKVKQELGTESEDSFLKRTLPYENEYLSTKKWLKSLSQIEPEEPSHEKERQQLIQEIANLQKNPDLKKRFKLNRLLRARKNIKNDLSTQETQLNFLNAKIKDPDAYLERQYKYASTRPDYLPELSDRDPMPHLLKQLEYYEGIKTTGEDPIESWFDDTFGYAGSCYLSQVPGKCTARERILNNIDDVTRYDMQQVERVLKDKYDVSLDELYEHRESTATKKRGRALFSPREQTFTQKIATWFKKISSPQASYSQIQRPQSKIKQLYNYFFIPPHTNRAFPVENVKKTINLRKAYEQKRNSKNYLGRFSDWVSSKWHSSTQ